MTLEEISALLTGAKFEYHDIAAKRDVRAFKRNY